MSTRGRNRPDGRPDMLAGRPPRRIVYALWLGVTVAATDARKTSGAAGHATRTRKLATGATADARHTALPAWTATGPAVLAARAAVAISVTTASTRVLLEDHVRGGGARRSSASRSFSRRHRHDSDRCSNCAANYKWFDEVQFC
jgi:hypothetical protein